MTENSEEVAIMENWEIKQQEQGRGNISQIKPQVPLLVVPFRQFL